ncbi:hypothetical protein ACIRSS_04830 [Amycolatopsis sp. NPDC101161]
MTAAPARDPTAVTVTGPSLTRADACATATFGSGEPRWVTGQRVQT